MQTATQLEDSRPQIDTPLRIKSSANVPSRIGRQSKDEHIKSNAFSPAAFAQSGSLIKQVSSPQKKNIRDSDATSKQPKLQHEADITTSLKDYTMLAFSSKRAGKREVEASAYISLAVIYDNQGNLKKGIENYKLYLDIMSSIGDVSGQCLAYNCIGVSYMLLAAPVSDRGISATALAPSLMSLSLKINEMEEKLEEEEGAEGGEAGTASSSSKAKKARYIQEAIAAHEKHLEIADAGGAFVAHTNLGLAHAMAGEVTAAARHHQDALRSSIKMQSIYGQSIAVGNLGLLAMLKGDKTTARTCFEQHVQLIQALQDPEAEVNAWKMLARLAIAEENHGDAVQSLEQARLIASRNKLFSELRRIHCLIGDSQTALQFGDFLSSMAASAAASSS